MDWEMAMEMEHSLHREGNREALIQKKKKKTKNQKTKNEGELK